MFWWYDIDKSIAIVSEYRHYWFQVVVLTFLIMLNRAQSKTTVLFIVIYWNNLTGSIHMGVVAS